MQGIFKPTRNSGHEPLPDASLLAPLSHLHPPTPFRVSRNWATAWPRDLLGICPLVSSGEWLFTEKPLWKGLIKPFPFCSFLMKSTWFYISMYIYQKIPHTQKCKGNEEEESEYWVLNPYKSPNCSILNLCIILKWIKLLYSPTSWEIRVMAKHDQAKYFSNLCTSPPKNNHKIWRISFPTNVQRLALKQF